MKLGYKLKIALLLVLSVFLLTGCEWQNKEKIVPVFQGLTFEMEGSQQLLLRDGNYYASRHAYIVIGIHFLNPDDQPILSLNINETEVLSFEFLSGSTNQKVKVLVDAGSTLGSKNYVVSNLKYLNKDASSEVVMNGNDTISLEVIGNQIPSSTITLLYSTYVNASVEITVNDEDKAIDPTSLKAVLYEGETNKGENPLYEGKQTVQFGNLTPNKAYTVRVYASYSLFEESDQQNVMLYEYVFATLNKSITIGQVAHHTVNFTLATDEELTLSKLELYKNGALDQTISNLSARTLSNLLSNTNYELKATFTYEDNDILTISSNFKTLSKSLPTLSIKNVRPDEVTATFELEVTDRMLTGSFASIKVYRGSTLLQTFPDLSRRIIEGLDNNYEYRLEVTYTYDLQDGVGQRVLTESKFFTTATPTTVPTSPGTDLEQIVTSVVAMVEDSVIGVSNFGPILENSGVQVSLGSGVLYKRIANLTNPSLGEVPGNIESYTYYAFTNKHVIETESSPEDINRIKVYIDKEKLYIDAELMGKDAKVDLAVIRFTHTTYYNVAALGNSEEVVKGSFAIAIGNPSGYNYYGSVTFGVISHPKRFVPEDYDSDGVIDFNAQYVQHDVAINPGNSGGGLFNLKGELIGINTMKFVDAKIDNMGFAVPIDIIKLLAFSYLEEGIAPPRARLGITIIAVMALTPALIEERELIAPPAHIDSGVYIVDIAEDTTISDTIISKHDILLAFDGVNIYSSTELAGLLSDVVKYGIGSNVEITFYNRSEDRIETILVTLKP